ncbi:hypothetical protein [Bacillus sp. JCM 19041]|uniref:hypothetical protein n=1 Tax=Bacillus sp. JCM 19041 TaxID=1460637 RepID=UPI000A94BB28
MLAIDQHELFTKTKILQIDVVVKCNVAPFVASTKTIVPVATSSPINVPIT